MKNIYHLQRTLLLVRIFAKRLIKNSACDGLKGKGFLKMKKKKGITKSSRAILDFG
jgi:hypothetical protein